MTEPNEPKIVHFSPRAQAPVQDTTGNREPDEQLFGLEELLQQLPPIRKLHLEKGRLTDLVRLYPDMKRTFDAPELLPEAVIASAMVRRRMELLLFRADDRREAGYALVTVCSPYGYVLVHALTIYPYLRGQLLGRVAMELIARCYAGKKGILYCQSRTCVALPERERLLTKNGYRDTGFRFRWGRAAGGAVSAPVPEHGGHHARGAATAAGSVRRSAAAGQRAAHDPAGGVNRRTIWDKV